MKRANVDWDTVMYWRSIVWSAVECSINPIKTIEINLSRAELTRDSLNEMCDSISSLLRENESLKISSKACSDKKTELQRDLLNLVKYYLGLEANIAEIIQKYGQAAKEYDND